MLNYHSSGSAKKAAIIAIAVVALGLSFYFLRQRSPDKPLTREEILTRQMEELDKLRQEALANPLTEEEKNKQMEELEKLRKQSEANPLSQEELNKQMEELEKLKTQQ